MCVCVHSQQIDNCQDVFKFKEYEDDIFELFRKTYITNTIYYRNQRVVLKKFPPEYDERSSFYHITCQNYEHTGNECDRVPNLRRYERITWAQQAIENCVPSCCDDLLVWENERRRSKNVLLYCDKIKYLVVLGKRNSYMQITTAYPVEYEHTRQKLLEEYRKYKANNASV